MQDRISGAETIRRCAMVDLQELAGISSSGVGVTRLAYTPEDRAAGEWFSAKCRAAGLTVEVDPVGNRFAWTVGDRKERRLLVGSHLDSVFNAGSYDGTVGVVLAIELATYLRDCHYQVPMALAAFACEESTRFGFGTIGSRYLVGDVTPAAFRTMVDRDRIPLDRILADFLKDEVVANSPMPLEQHFSAFLETHIDQGTTLTGLNATVGVVTTIVGVHRTSLSWTGTAAHSGGQLREHRRDALIAAADFVTSANALWREMDPKGREFSFTIGQFNVVPNSPNTIPGEVRMIFDLRAPEGEIIASTRDRMLALAKDIARRHRVGVDAHEIATSNPVRMDPSMIAALVQASKRAGVDLPECVSLAGHDALVIGRRLPTAMLLLANPTGLSHSPEEGVSQESLRDAAAILIEAVPSLVGGP